MLDSCAANDCKKSRCSLWAQAIPAIAQLVEHLTVDCAEIRWSLARFRVAGLLCSHPPGTSTGSVSAVLFVSLSILPVHTAVCRGLGRAVLWKMRGRDDLGCFSTPILLSCSCSKKRSKSSRPPFSQCWTPVQQTIAKSLDVAGLLCSHPPGTSTGSVSAVLFVSLSILPVHTAVCRGLGRAVLWKMRGRDDLGGFSTPILLNCSCSKKTL